MIFYRKPMRNRPLDLPDGAPMFFMPASKAEVHDERCVTYAWLSQRKLFGEVYRRLLPESFEAMTHEGGVMIGSFIRSADIVAGLAFPGDIDVLVIPYEKDELVLSDVLAIEIKIIRAAFAKQGKSPNEFGFSQAKGLLAAGFPYVAVGHLIVSDASPANAWQEVGMTTIINADEGTCTPLQTVWHDMLPVNLLRRSHGRLRNNCPDPRIGHFSAYPGDVDLWFPEGVRATLNPLASRGVMDGVYAYYQSNYRNFLWTRCYPPIASSGASGVVPDEHSRQMLDKMCRDFSLRKKGGALE